MFPARPKSLATPQYLRAREHACVKEKKEFDTFITEEDLTHIAQCVNEEVTLEIQDQLGEKKKVFTCNANHDHTWALCQ